MEIKTVKPNDNRYLNRLLYLENPPDNIYYYGKIPDFDGKTEVNSRFPNEGVGRPKTVAIVGARKMTVYGETWAFKIAKELAELGIIIVSGLAIGIDSAAHRGALAGKGRTLAFLGTPIDKVYPAENNGLFREIIKHDGAVFSEIPANGKYYPKTSFLERNRLIAGVSDAVVIIEADERSGSLNTASHALEQGVPVFALPGDVHRQMSRGCNRLFNKGASAITCVDDVLDILFSGSIKSRKRQKAKLFGTTDDETLILKLISDGFTSGDEIVNELKKKMDFDVSRFNIAITTLEIKGVVKREYGNQWILS